LEDGADLGRTLGAKRGKHSRERRVECQAPTLLTLYIVQANGSNWTKM
jgi:hypothetical protein